MKPYWIKERHNPQLGVYYVACGQMSETAAKAYERSKYADNTMHRFDDEASYLARLAELRKDGERVQ
jgi:hypothetical protein